MRAEIKAAVDQAADEADAQPAASTVNLMAHIYAGDPVLLGTPTIRAYVSTEPVAMIVARASENVIDALDAPVIRVAAKDTFLPAVDDLCRAVERVLAY